MLELSQKLNIVYVPNKLMSMDFRSTANGIHSSSPNAIHVAQCTKAQSPLAPSGKCSEIYKDASNIYNQPKFKKKKKNNIRSIDE